MDKLETASIPRKRRRNSLRLPGYDYRQAGYYFVTTCAKEREELFGTIQNGRMVCNRLGQIVAECWHDLSNHYKCVLDEYIIMPNHVHGIIIIPTSVGAGLKPAPTEVGLSEIVRALKTFSSRRINARNRTRGRTIWRRGFYDHIIRNEKELQYIREYIRTNPKQWARDRNLMGVFM